MTSFACPPLLASLTPPHSNQTHHHHNTPYDEADDETQPLLFERFGVAVDHAIDERRGRDRRVRVAHRF